ncbi:ferric reductase-like transmembrane domain-containing protein [Anderseniella sp. Alg231-50]|uniref:ferric reductase-like transmembrane domain-containing protein n=1 Tax=Anderseniella sp. Alg231-50 TaxID=1922226 RepID=UPI000D55623C
MHASVLIAGYLIVTLTPLVLSILQGRALRPFWDEISSGLAMTAFAILLVEFVLSGRFKVISARIGMDVTMRLHQLLARTALVFILIHPFLYQTPFLTFPVPWDVSRQLTLGLGIGSLASGLAGWILLPVLVLTAVLRDQLPYRYETWRLMHGVGAVLIAAMAMHHTLNAGRYSSDPLLAGFWVVLLALALGSLLYSYVIVPLKEASRPYLVTSVQKIARRTWELTIKARRGNELEFEAGQFVWLNLGHSPFSLHENPFSISSAPGNDSGIQFVIKQAGDFTSRIGEVSPGTTAFLDGPHGNLTLKGRTGTGIALIAGGVGVVPLLSIARQLDKDSDPRPLVLLYGNRLVDQIVYKDELRLLAGKDNCDVRFVLSEPEPGWSGLTGMIDRAMLDDVFGFEDASHWLYLVCGPSAMLDVVEKALIARGVPAHQIVSERFYYD